jgi:hypothetical protein
MGGRHDRGHGGEAAGGAYECPHVVWRDARDEPGTAAKVDASALEDERGRQCEQKPCSRKCQYDEGRRIHQLGEGGDPMGTVRLADLREGVATVPRLAGEEDQKEARDRRKQCGDTG